MARIVNFTLDAEFKKNKSKSNSYPIGFNIICKNEEEFDRVLDILRSSHQYSVDAFEENEIYCYIDEADTQQEALRLMREYKPIIQKLISNTK